MGVKVCYVTLEMVDVQFGQRLLANGAWVDGMKFRTAGLSDEDWASIAQAMGQMSGLPISFARIRYIEDLSAEIRRKVDMGECGMLVVDYLQLMDCKEKISSNRDDLRVAKISRGLKALSTDCNIPVVALAQVKRSATGCPTLSDLRDSGAIEQDADGVIFMHRLKTQATKRSCARTGNISTPSMPAGISTLCSARPSSARDGSAGQG